MKKVLLAALMASILISGCAIPLVPDRNTIKIPAGESCYRISGSGITSSGLRTAGDITLMALLGPLGALISLAASPSPQLQCNLTFEKIEDLAVKITSKTDGFILAEDVSSGIKIITRFSEKDGECKVITVTYNDNVNRFQKKEKVCDFVSGTN